MDVRSLSTIALAYLGDAVYEQFVRERLIRSKSFGGHADLMNKAGVSYVRAGAQSEALGALSGILSEEEAALVRRAKNHRTAERPKNADPMEYKNATAFEALLGYLRLLGRDERCSEIMRLAAEFTEGKK